MHLSSSGECKENSMCDIAQKGAETVKHILVQYIDLVQERDEVRQMISSLRRKLKKINEEGNVKDVVKGGAGGQQNYHIDGFPVADEDETRYLLKKHIRILEQREHDIAEKVLEVDEYLNSLNDSRMRRMITFKYIQGLTWNQTADAMKGNHTADSCRMDMKRFLKKL